MIGTPLGWSVHEIMSKEWDDDDPGKRRWWMLDGGKNALPLRVFLASCQLLHVSEGTAKKSLQHAHLAIRRYDQQHLAFPL